MYKQTGWCIKKGRNWLICKKAMEIEYGNPRRKPIQHKNCYIMDYNIDKVYCLNEASKKWGLDRHYLFHCITKNNKFVIDIDRIKIGDDWLVTEEAMGRVFRTRKK